ncbi:FG-GAP-like repeat-containing protein [Micromonospora aurantiaca]|uniref:FG-GAP-like repeat-containing protein n=1 Tax=Micromonospora aurantiaca (nom. illeg.) TaxID=47850 RepID=UPI001476E7F2|nr:FG-GAP-like repeat-containing protein [Micromonospora aurantiaca]
MRLFATWRALTRRRRPLTVAAVVAILAVTVPAGADAALPLPPNNPTTVDNPTPTVPAGSGGVGGIGGNAAVSATGVAQYEIPLKVIPGRGGFQPKLSLEYSSQATDGQLGVGFSLSGLSQISLCPKTIAVDELAQGVQAGSDAFCLNGQRLVSYSGTYGADGAEYRTVPDVNVRVKSFREAGTPASELGPTSFMVWWPDGTVEKYGDGDNRSQVRPTSSTTVLNTAWLKWWAEDRSGNAVHVTYDRRTVSSSNPSEVERWVTVISYGYNRNNKFDRVISFDYEPRPDPSFGFFLGQPRESTKRLKSVTMSLKDGRRARKYTMSYDNGGVSKASKLSRVRECGITDSDCLRDTILQWTPGAEGFLPAAEQTTPFGAALVPPAAESQIVAADFDRDGRTDLAWPEATNWQYVMANATSTNQVYSAKKAGPANPTGVSATAWPLDYDGDGRMDLLPRAFPKDPTWKVLLTQPLGQTVVSTPFTGGLNHNDPDAGALPGDFDGDGYQDVIEYARQGSSNLWTWTWRRNTGTVGPQIGNTAPTDDKAFTAPQPIGLQSEHPASVTVAAVYGDGRDKLLFSHDGHLIAMDVAKGTTFDTKITSKVLQLDKQWLDLNGDGLIDLVTNGNANGVKGPDLYYWLNTGRGLTQPTNSGVTATAHAFANATVVDYDGDGRRDLLVPRLADGAQFQPLYTGLDVIRARTLAAATVVMSRTKTTVEFTAMSTNDYDRQGPRAIDANGDGLTDILLVERPPLGTTGSPVMKLFLHRTAGGAGGDRDDLLWRIYEGDQHPTQTQLPPTVEFTYAPLTDSAIYAKQACTRLTGFACLSGGSTYVVAQVRRDAGVDNHTQMVSNYSYSDGRTSRYRRTTTGFAEQKITTFPTSDTSRTVIERSFYSNSIHWNSPRLDQRWTIRNLPGGRQSLEQTINNWATRKTGSSSQLFFDYVGTSTHNTYEFPKIANLGTITTEDFYLLGKQPFTKATTVVTGMDAYGNPATTETTSVSIDKVQADRVTVTRTADIDAANWLIRRPKKVVTTSQVIDPSTGTWGPAQTRTTAYTYEADTGKLDTATFYASDAAPGRRLRTAFDYDAGNIIRRTDYDLGTGAAREATFAYDGLGYPHAAQNGRGQTSYTGFDPVLAVPKVTVDVNGLRTDLTFDTLGRLVKTTAPTGAEQTWSYGQEQINGEYLRSVEHRDGTGAVTRAIVDRLGRPVIERVKGFDTTMREKTTTYRPEGPVASRTTLHPVGTPATQIDKTAYDYDDAGRMTQAREPDTTAARTWSYDALTATYTDTRGHRHRTTLDHNGRVVRQVDEDGTATPPTRTYGYGPFGNLTSTRDTATAASESRYTYDDQGALLSRTDGERGTATYTYTAFGQLSSATDANNRLTTFTYDVLGRETARTTTRNGTITSTTTRTWDTSQGRTTLGALMQVTSDDRTNDAVAGVVSTDYTYDPFGRISQVSQTQPDGGTKTASETLTAGYGFDSYGRLTSVRYPKLAGQAEGVKVDYVYGPAASSNGRLATVRVGTELLWTAKSTDGQDRLTAEESGDGVATTQTFDWAGRLLTTTSATAPSDVNPNATLFSEGYTYDDEGNLKSRSQQAVAEKFTYDALDHLSTATTSNTTTGAVYQTDSWTYDKLGNLTTSELRGDYTYGDPKKPTQVTKVTGGLFGTRAYGYDAVGNQTARPDGTIAYNDIDLPTRVTSRGTATDLRYDGNGERIRKAGPATVVSYLPGLYERHQNGTNTEHRLLVSAAGRTVATLIYREAADVVATRQETLYPHTDHLGSPRLITKDRHTSDSGHQATVVETRSYDAFGKLRNPDLTHGDDQYTTGVQSRTLDDGFTGHDEDDEFGLVNMRARLYDPTLGRFTTPDPVVTGANATQAYNRYTYVSGNPLRYTDPTGHIECDGGSHCVTPTPTCAQDPWMCGGSGPAPETDPCQEPGAFCADPVTVWGPPTAHDPQDDVTAPGAGDPDPHAGTGSSDPDHCRGHVCRDGGDDESDCAPLCRDSFVYQAPASTPKQANVVTPTASEGNGAESDAVRGSNDGSQTCTCGAAGAAGAAGAGSFDGIGGEDGAGGAPGDWGRTSTVGPGFVYGGLASHGAEAVVFVGADKSQSYWGVLVAQTGSFKLKGLKVPGGKPLEGHIGTGIEWTSSDGFDTVHWAGEFELPLTAGLSLSGGRIATSHSTSTYGGINVGVVTFGIGLDDVECEH